MMKEITEIIFSNCNKMATIKSIIDEVAKTDITVLIKGESGCGKELVARTIHNSSFRRAKPFVKVNCAAIPPDLLESELFGFEKGAFTGAHLKKPGKFEMANGGTILLNDIEEMDLSLQAKLLQVLQDGAFSRLGGDGELAIDTRVIVTTKNNIERSLAEGRFREDLFFRINVINLTIPPLRDRIEQIVPLSEYFFNLYKKKYGREVSPLSPKLIEIFKSYSWPGNIRELENFIKRIVILGEEEMVLQSLYEKKEVEEKLRGISPISSSNTESPTPLFNLKEVGKKAAELAERELIEATLQQTRWNRKEAARLLRISYKALLYKVDKYGLDNGLSQNCEDRLKPDRWYSGLRKN
ncbi:MAG: sigma-54 interaction domain-containing protein [Thermodesulfobacteriota bacterium]